MDMDEWSKEIRRRVSLSGRILFWVGLVGILMFSAILASFYLETVDSELAAAGNQLRLFVLSNTENFETRDEAALKKAASNLVRSPLVSHIAVYDPQSRLYVWAASPAYVAGSPDAAALAEIHTKAKLMMATQGSDLVRMDLPSGRSLYRAFTRVTARKGMVTMGEAEIGFFKKEIVSRALERMRIPGAVAIAAVLMLVLIAGGMAKRWESRKVDDLTEFVVGEFEKIQADANRKLVVQKKEQETKDVDGGSFFNIMEAIRDISGAADLQTFVRRAVLASVRLFRCRMVSFYVHESSDAKTTRWKLSGRYDGKGYSQGITEPIDLSSDKRLNEALAIGSTELLEGYPMAAAQSLLIGVSADKPIGALLLQNKVGISFDSKDLMAARVFAGFLPNLLSWHVK